MTDQARATRFVILYLVNLLLLPGLGFLLFCYYWFKWPQGELSRFYGRFVWFYSALAVLLLVILPGLSALIWFHSEYFWVWTITLWVSCHGLLVVCGVLALAACMTTQKWVVLLPPMFR